MFVICVAGMPASGKGVFIEEAKKKGLPVYVMGDVVREETLRRGLKLTSHNLNMVAEDLRKKYGKVAIAKKIVEKIRETKHNTIIIDGVRSLDEIEYFKKTLGETIIVAIHASPKTRFERIRKRSRPGDPKTWEEFVERDLVELSFGLGNVIALADYMIVNEGSLNELRREAEKVLEKCLEIAKEVK